LRLFYVFAGGFFLRFFCGENRIALATLPSDSSNQGNFESLPKGGGSMTLNILFMTITINKRQRSSEEINHDVQVSKYFEETKIKNESMISKMF
jgi:uncharacterized protein (TIGR02413 family)